MTITDRRIGAEQRGRVPTHVQFEKFVRGNNGRPLTVDGRYDIRPTIPAEGTRTGRLAHTDRPTHCVDVTDVGSTETAGTTTTLGLVKDRIIAGTSFPDNSGIGNSIHAVGPDSFQALVNGLVLIFNQGRNVVITRGINAELRPTADEFLRIIANLQRNSSSRRFERSWQR